MTRTDSLYKCVDLLTKGTSVSTVGISGVGREDFLRQFRELLGDQATLITINIDNIVSIDGLECHRIINYEISRSLNTFSENSTHGDSTFLLHQNTLEIVRRFVKESSKPIIIQFNDLSRLYQLDEAFFNSLASIRRIDRTKISFMFADIISLLTRLKPSGSGELYELINSKVFFISLPTIEEFQRVINYSSSVFDMNLTQKQVKQIYGLTHGHYGLSHYLVSYLKEHGKIDETTRNYLNDPGIEIRIKKSINSLNLTHKNIISKIVSKKELSAQDMKHAQYLVNCSLLSDKYKINVKILQEYFEYENVGFSGSLELETKEHKQEKINIENGQVIINGTQIENELSKRELDVFTYLLDNANQVVSRDDVADVIWKYDSQEKYSDWAIDKTISRLRKKLHDDGSSPRFIKTVKGRGFKLTF